MSDLVTDAGSDALRRQRALSRWDNDGGAGLEGPQTASGPADKQLPFPRMDDAEFEALHCSQRARSLPLRFLRCSQSISVWLALP